MSMKIKAQPHSYHLVVDDDKLGPAQTIQFEGSGLQSAMRFARTTFPWREIKLYEDGHCLGKVRCTREGYWVVLPRDGLIQMARDPGA